MKKRLLLVLLFYACISSCKAAEIESGNRVLVFSKTLGFRHWSIRDGIKAIHKLGRENGFDADHTQRANLINKENLKRYKAIIFLNPTGEVLGLRQKVALQQFIRSGGGFVGVHSASDCLHKWEWYGKMIGAYFNSHPKVQQASIQVVNQSHPSTKQLNSTWVHRDEWYNFDFKNPSVNVLLNLDERSYSGGKHGDHHPIAWYHEFEGGRVFYTGLGHTRESYKDKRFLNHLLGGVLYALGQN